MLCRRQNKMPKADLINGERLCQQSSRKVSFMLKQGTTKKTTIKGSKDVEQPAKKRGLSHCYERTQRSL